jgi:toxin CptA
MKPIRINFKPSILLTAFISLMSLVMCRILILLPLAWQIKWLLVVVILLLAAHSICVRGLLLLPVSLLALNVNVKNELQLTCRDGAKFVAVVYADSVVTPYLTIVHFQTQQLDLIRRLLFSHVVILPDMVDAESYRQLRVWLRWGQAHQSQV